MTRASGEAVGGSNSGKSEPELPDCPTAAWLDCDVRECHHSRSLRGGVAMIVESLSVEKGITETQGGAYWSQMKGLELGGGNSSCEPCKI